MGIAWLELSTQGAVVDAFRRAPRPARAEALKLVRPVPSTEPVHLPVDSTGRRLCGPGEWVD